MSTLLIPAGNKLTLTKSKQVYVFLFILAAGCAFVKNLYYAWHLTPTAFGLFSLVLLVASFSQYFATVGILDGLAREVPLLSGQGKEVRTLRSAALTALIIFSVVAAILLVLGSCVLMIYKPELSALLWTGPILIVNVILNGLMCDLRIRKYTTEYAAMLFLKSGVSLVIVYPMSEPLKLSEVLASEVIGMFTCIIVSFFCWSSDLTFALNFKKMINKLIQLGMPFTLGNLCQNVVMNVDRWAVQFSLGAAALGSYTFCMTFATLGLIMVNMIQVYEGPRILSHYGATNDNSAVIVRVKRLLIVMFLLFGLMVIPIIKLVPIFLLKWYPQYLDTTEIIVPIYIGAAAMAMSFFDVLFSVYGSGRVLFFIQLSLLVVVLLACGIAVGMAPDLNFFAIIFAITRVLNFILGWSFGFGKIKKLMKYV